MLTEQQQQNQATKIQEKWKKTLEKCQWIREEFMQMLPALGSQWTQEYDKNVVECQIDRFQTSWMLIIVKI